MLVLQIIAVILGIVGLVGENLCAGLCGVVGRVGEDLGDGPAYGRNGGGAGGGGSADEKKSGKREGEQFQHDVYPLASHSSIE